MRRFFHLIVITSVLFISLEAAAGSVIIGHPHGDDRSTANVNARPG
jgi:hypothetical protein